MRRFPLPVLPQTTGTILERSNKYGFLYSFFWLKDLLLKIPNHFLQVGEEGGAQPANKDAASWKDCDAPADGNAPFLWCYYC